MQHGEMMVQCLKVKQTRTKKKHQYKINKKLLAHKQGTSAHKQKNSYKEKQNKAILLTPTQNPTRNNNFKQH